MKQLQLIDRVVVEIKSEDTQEVSNEWIARQLEMVAQRIRDCYKGGTSDWEGNDVPENTELLWEHECPNYGGFRMGDKSLISMHYYGSEPKPKKYIIIAHNYDRENSDAYPVDGRLFASEEEAKAYLRDHIDSIKSNHWTATRVDGEDRYSEEFTDAGWHAEDWDDGSSLELTITEVRED